MATSPRMSMFPSFSTLARLSVCVFLLAACDKSAAEAGADKAAENGAAEPAKPAVEPLSQEQLEQLYVDSKARFDATDTLPEDSFRDLKANLMRVANEAEDVHLRTNASLLLGSIHEQMGDQRSAISFYRQGAELTPGEVDTHIVLALALAKDKQWDEAIAEQWQVVNMIPDDLMGWLLLGELHVKGGKLDEAAKVYGAYEMRRKGLLDGLTLKRDGEYIKDEAERVACAEALVVANDNGTSMGLLYALDSDPSPVVRERVAAIMGEQRLAGYRTLLGQKRETETNDAVKKAIEWAIAEIDREPLETAPGPVPEQILDQVQAEAERLEAEAKAGAAEGEAGEATATGAETEVGADAAKPEGSADAQPAEPAKAGK